MSYTTRISCAWTAFLQLFRGRYRSHLTPLTPEQRDDEEESFIASIDRSAVCALASSHNDEKPCRIVNSVRGGFNVCFFIEFRNCITTWVVRIPIEPAVHGVWDKLQSEVATMR